MPGPTTLRLLSDKREVDVDGDLPLEDLAAARQLGVELDAEVTPVDRGRDGEGDTRVAAEVRADLAEAAGRLDLTHVALDLQLTGETDAAVVGDVEAGGGELQLRVLLGVEEIRRHQVALELRLVDVDRLHVDGADQLGLVPAGQGCLVAIELAAVGGDVVVGDGKGDRGMNRVDGPGAGRDLQVDGVGAHGCCLSFDCCAGLFEVND